MLRAIPWAHVCRPIADLRWPRTWSNVARQPARARRKRLAGGYAGSDHGDPFGAGSSASQVSMADRGSRLEPPRGNESSMSSTSSSWVCASAASCSSRMLRDRPFVRVRATSGARRGRTSPPGWGVRRRTSATSGSANGGRRTQPRGRTEPPAVPFFPPPARTLSCFAFAVYEVW